jgi:hypothetical protein
MGYVENEPFLAKTDDIMLLLLQHVYQDQLDFEESGGC